MPPELRKRLVSRRFVERLERHHRDSNMYLVKALGEFPRAADDTVVALGDLEQAQLQAPEAGLPVVLGLDVALFGDDETVLALREGPVIRILEAWKGKSLMETAGRVADAARRLQEEHGRRARILVDDSGLGGGVTDRLREQGFVVAAFNGGNRAGRSRATSSIGGRSCGSRPPRCSRCSTSTTR